MSTSRKCIEHTSPMCRVYLTTVSSTHHYYIEYTLPLYQVHLATVSSTPCNCIDHSLLLYRVHLATVSIILRYCIKYTSLLYLVHLTSVLSTPRFCIEHTSFLYWVHFAIASSTPCFCIYYTSLVSSKPCFCMEYSSLLLGIKLKNLKTFIVQVEKNQVIMQSWLIRCFLYLIHIILNRAFLIAWSLLYSELCMYKNLPFVSFCSVSPSNAFTTAFSTIFGNFSARSFNFYKEILKLQPIKSVFFLKEKDFLAN